MIRPIQRVCEERRNGHYEVTYIDTDPASVYEWVAHEMVAKYLDRCHYIRGIKDKNNYHDGTREIVIYYDNDVRMTCTIKW